MTDAPRDKSLLFRLGERAGPTLRRGKWLWKSLTGRREESIAAEHAVGRDLAAAIRADLPPVEDEIVRRGVTGIGAHLVGRLVDNRRRFEFDVLRSDEPNAFALPGGVVMITEGLVDLVERDPDALAFVLGHEIGHVVRRHQLRRIMTDKTIGLALRALPQTRVAGGLIQSAGGKLLSSAHSRDAERVADRFGAALARSGGFDPRASIELLQRLARASGARGDTLFGYFSSHPPFAERIDELQAFLRGQD